jgi:hypothetical protein
MMKRIVFVAMLPAFFFNAVTARAHALLDHATPQVGSTVRTAPRSLSLWFTQKLEPSFSTIEVLNANGARVDQGKAQVDRTDATSLRVGLKALPPGTYQVHWHVLSVDTHKTEGNFSFTVGQ